MNTKLLMITSAVFLGVLGIGFSFLPDEILVYLDISENRMLTVLLQILGAMYLGFGMMNWMAKGNIIGGIYGRPLAMGNFLHFMVSSFALLKVAFEMNTPLIWGLTIPYVIFATAFAYISFTHPGKNA